MDNKEKKFGFKILVYLVLILYISILISILIFKNGDASILSGFMNNKSFIEKLSFAQVIPFATIKEFIFDAPTYSIAIRNLLGNIIIFCPLGFLLPIAFTRLSNWKKIFIVSLGISLLIEVIQLITGYGFFDVDDLILNVFGAMIGYFVYKLFVKNIMKNKRL
ncbi:MAG: VanZ family protein [Clostridium sp.]